MQSRSHLELAWGLEKTLLVPARLFLLPSQLHSLTSVQAQSRSAEGTALANHHPPVAQLLGLGTRADIQEVPRSPSV